MRRHVGELEVRLPSSASTSGSAPRWKVTLAELVEALVVGCGADPAFADEQDRSWSFRLSRRLATCGAEDARGIVDHQACVTSASVAPWRRSRGRKWRMT